MPFTSRSSCSSAAAVGLEHVLACYQLGIVALCVVLLSTVLKMSAVLKVEVTWTLWCLQVCGDAEVWGDFIVPVASAHLDGAINVDVDDCFHSPLGTKLKFFGPW